MDGLQVEQATEALQDDVADPPATETNPETSLQHATGSTEDDEPVTFLQSIHRGRSGYQIRQPLVL
ncbi:hypothetical protein MCOR02_010533 [Pyricularia oryzae]|nr:hypothetical protein MCOR02_010533 [Pyricularia oryzae]KAI6321926.1 hypothetical protein MCOR34_002398 [Pyricularia oryzae]KAI6416672.1 hypothetical protein MCOR20_000886 [Pyricularia oryzae]KAI6454173.1 hypothetical protein MCOR22_000204 [Pyricularia oryzae]KAI6476021.1 hypothetical protein MCOR17_001306 [Pyricularia oryzae]